MDNIMKRFKCFNTIMSNNTSTDEDEKEEEDETINEPDGEGDADTGTKKAATAEDRQIEVILPKMAKVNANYADSGYWKVDPLEDELNNLLADYEWSLWHYEAGDTKASFTLFACWNIVFRHACPLVPMREGISE